MEKEIIRGNKVNAKKILGLFIIIGLIIFWIVWSIETSDGFYNKRLNDTSYVWTNMVPYFGSMTFLPFFVLGLIFYFWTSKMDIIVTNKRVYGVAAFGKRIDIPLNKISSVSTCFFKGIGVSSSSGIIKFRLIKNNLDVHEAINKLLLELQDTDNNLKKDKVSNLNVIEELKKWKELFEDGTITEEEFNNKKIDLLK